MRVHAAEIRFHLCLVEVNRGRDDVRGRLVADLNDVFAEIGLDRHDAVRLEEIVEPDLLGDHGLALGDRLGARLPADVENQPARLFRRHRMMHVAAGGAHPLLIGFEIEIEMRVVLDVAGGIPQRIEFRQPVDRGLAPVDEAEPLPEHALQLRVGDRRPGVRLESRRGDGERHGSACARRARLSPIGGTSVIPASTSAT